jgi:hypothetical protein
MEGLRMPACLLGAVLLSACDAERTQAPAPTPSFAVGAGVEAAATGSGHFVAADGELRKFAFAAITHRNGDVGGQFQLVAGNADLVAHGTVTCMTVIDNQAWIGGTLDRNSIGAPFTHGWWRAVDHAATGDPDQVSLLVIANNPDGNLARAFCDDTPDGFPPLNTVTQGNITVR